MNEVIYQEQDSTFYSNGKNYDLNLIFKLTHDLPINKIELGKLVWVLDYVKDIDNDRINKSDVSVPILVWKSEGKELVVDGLHRLLKARKLGIKYLNYKRVTDKIMNEALIKNKSIISKW